ncbi:MAG: HmuY family protein [Flavobacteriales bacterium]
MKREILIATLLVVSLSSCLKEELPVPARERDTTARSMQVCMGPGYQEQLWLDISSGEVVRSNVKTAWDLAFESAPEGWRIYLNGSKMMTAFNIGPVDMTHDQDTVGMTAGRHIDAPSGHRDSTAIGDWRGHGDVFIIDLGMDAIGIPQGLRKFKFIAATATEYVFEVARLNGTQHSTISLPKDPSRNFTCYKTGTGVVDIEPERGAWDLVVTQYTHQFYEPFLPYLVVGTLSAPGVRASVVHGSTFEAVTLADTLAHPFNAERDAIGYDWKEYVFETASYVVDHSRVYIVEDAEGLFYKLQFTDFYSEGGQVGCPAFRMVAL